MSSAPEVVSFFDRATCTATHLVIDPRTQQAAIVDPVLDFDSAAGQLHTSSADAVLAEAARRGVHIVYVLETHVHADHLTASAYVRERTGARVVIGQGIVDVQRILKPVFNASDLHADGRQFDRLVREGSRFALGALEVRVMETPGHTPACVTYLIGNAAFVGDTLFMPDYGTARADFPGGDSRALYRSIQRILALPDATRLFLCHDYLAPGRAEYAWQTTVAAEKRNVHLMAAADEDAFVSMRAARDATLRAPALMFPAVQFNVRAGQLEADAAGRAYFKLFVEYRCKHRAS